MRLSGRSLETVSQQTDEICGLFLGRSAFKFDDIDFTVQRRDTVKYRANTELLTHSGHSPSS